MVHCDVCDRCCDGFHHHCAWTGTCIAVHNRAEFLGFLWSLGCLAVGALSSIYQLCTKEPPTDEHAEPGVERPEDRFGCWTLSEWDVFVATYATPAMIFAIGMAVCHTCVWVFPTLEFGRHDQGSGQ